MKSHLIPGNKGARKINENEKKLVKEYIKNGFNKRQAALKVYDVNKHSASNLTNQVLKRPVVQEYLTEQLDKIGLGIEDLNAYAHTAITNNLENGRPSQAVAATLLQFMYKLHNAVPASKSMNIKANVTGLALDTNVDELTKKLEKLNKLTQELL